MGKKKYCDQETVFQHIWNTADRDGLWDGDAATIAAAFAVTEDAAYDTLNELFDRGLIEKLIPGKFAIVNWRERDDPGEEESCC
jgi:hypothetical protein